MAQFCSLYTLCAALVLCIMSSSPPSLATCVSRGIAARQSAHTLVKRHQGEGGMGGGRSGVWAGEGGAPLRLRGGGDGISMKEGTCYGSRIAGRRPGIKPVPMRGSTEQAELFHGKRLNPAVFPPSAFINERRIFLNRRMDFVPPDEYKHMSDGGVYCEDGRTAFERAVRALKGLDFMDIEWCTAARDKSHIVIGSKVFGVWTAMTNQVIRETYEEDARRARATLAFAMTDRHLLAG